MEVSTPTVLGRYEVVKHLASGGMAEVLLARTAAPTGMRYVVLKKIRPDQACDAQFVEMFLDEARIATMLDHPNIVKVFETAEDRGEYFFAMEYVHGEDLRKVLMEVHARKDKVPIALVTTLVAGAAAGLHHAHKLLGPNYKPLGIVHRDVSPANILVGYDGSVKVTDFGIAKAALRTVETRSGTLKGKVSYMSPEQVTGKGVDRRSDVFALGIVLYELATARRLFKGDNDFLTMSSIVQGDIPKPSLFRADLPRNLEDIVMTALASAPADRFQSAEELRLALEAFTTSLGMRMSAGSVADYMRNLFGHRAEPWLVDVDEPTVTTSIDFDGSASGVVRPPETAVQHHALPQTMKPAASAPIVYARTDLTSSPVSPDDVDSTVPASGDSAERFAWMAEPTPIRKPDRRRLFVIAGGALAAAAIGIVIISKSTGSSDDEPPAAKVQMTATPARAPQPDPAPPEPEIARPEPPVPEVRVKPEPVVRALPAPKPNRPALVARPPATVKKADKKPARAAGSGSNWDPNALFAPK